MILFEGLSKQIINRAKLLIGKKSVAIEDVLKVLEEDKEFINNKKNDLIQKQTFKRSREKAAKEDRLFLNYGYDCIFCSCCQW